MASMLRFNVKLILLMLSKPARVWELVEEKNPGLNESIIFTLLPYSICLSMAYLIGPLRIFDQQDLSDFIFAILYGIVLPFSVISISAWLIFKISNSLGSKFTFKQCFTLIVYSIFPFFITHMMILVLDLSSYFEIVGIYSIYLYILAGRSLLPPAKRDFAVYIIISFLITSAIYFVIKYILGGIYLLLLYI